jgi:RHS repeat-associated protein
MYDAPIAVYDVRGHKFTGKERDGESGLDYFGARYYASALGRFMSTDPLRESGHPGMPQSWNRYSHTLGNPLRFVDKQGKCSSPAVGKGQVGICIGLYISSKTIGGLGHGDGRGPVGNDPRATYRAEIHLVVDPSKGSVTMTKNDAGTSTVTLVPGLLTLDGKGTSKTEVSKPTTDESGTVHFSVNNEAKNGLSYLPGAPQESIQTSLDLQVTQEGQVGVEGGKRTAYPSLEVYSYDSKGNVTPVLQIQETTPEALKKKDQVVPATTVSKKP